MARLRRFADVAADSHIAFSMMMPARMTTYFLPRFPAQTVSRRQLTACAGAHALRRALTR